MKDLSNENVIHVHKNGIQYLQFRKLLEYPEISHAYSLGLDKSFRSARANLQELPKEEFEQSLKCYKELANAIGEDYTNIAKPNQNHTDEVKIINSKICKDKPDFNLPEYENTDGFITDKKHLMLASTNADCILLLMYDPIKKVIANVHSGWKGTLQRISTKTIEKMKKEFNCNPEDIICCICPSIRKCHFEVSQDVRDLFYNEFKDLSEIDDIIEEKIPNKKWNIDTVLINKIILKQIGLKEENIIDSGICSVCNSDLVHSFRVEKQGYGLATALIKLIYSNNYNKFILLNNFLS